MASNKIEDYNKKQALIKIRKDEIEMINEEKLQEKNRMIQRREEKIHHTLEQNKKLENKNKEKILYKINHNDKKVYKIN